VKLDELKYHTRKGFFRMITSTRKYPFPKFIGVDKANHIHILKINSEGKIEKFQDIPPSEKAISGKFLILIFFRYC